MPHADRLARRLATALALVLLVPPARAAASPPRAGGGARLSAAAEQMFRDWVAAGRALPPDMIQRWGLDVPACDPTFLETPADAARTPPPGAQRITSVGLAPDTPINDRSGDATCAAGCGSRPLGQAETTIAAWGSYLLAGWNDTQGFCTGGAVQGYGWSLDGGATWVDGGDPPSPLPHGRFRGDPVHVADRKTGDFYVCGLYEDSTGSANSGLALARGRFSGGTFAFDATYRVAAGGANFLDKEWLAV